MQFRSLEQANLSSRVAQHLALQDGPLLLEGGTGVGKTRAYLAPVVASGRRVAVVLPSHALINQLLASTDLAACRGNASVEAFRPSSFYETRDDYVMASDAAREAQVMLCTSASVIIDQRLRGAYNASTQRDYLVFDEADQLPAAAALQQDAEVKGSVLRLYRVKTDLGIEVAVRSLLSRKRIEPEVKAAAMLMQEAIEEPAWFRTAGLTEDGGMALFHRLPGRLLKKISNRGSVAFVSATLSVNGRFDDFRGAMGIDAISSLSSIVEPAKHGAVTFHLDEEHPVDSPEWLQRVRETIEDAPKPALVITPSFQLSDQLAGPGITIRDRAETTGEAVAHMTGDVVVAAGAWAGLDTPMQWRSIIVPKVPFPAPTILDEKVESSYINARNEASRRLRQALGRGLRSPSAVMDFYLLDGRYSRVPNFLPPRFSPEWSTRIVEGAAMKVLTTRYERGAYRAAGLKKHGCFCHACGFIPRAESQIDVHHLHPLNEGVRVTTVDDLIPLCANCHRLAHTTSPPLTLEEIKLLMLEPAKPPGPS